MIKDLLAKYKTIVICGGTKTGKTTLSNACQDRPVIHTDDYLHLPWKDAPDAILEALKGKDRFLVEGVQCGRLLRKGLQADCIIWLSVSHLPLTPKQEQFNKGILTTFESWLEMSPKANVVYL